MEVWYRGKKLVEDTDYVIAGYSNNINVTTAETGKAKVQIEGIGSYGGTVNGEFEISYLPMEDSMYTISGTQGNQGYYISETAIVPGDGYTILSGEEEIKENYKKDGMHQITFRIRRNEDGALTEENTLMIKIDRTAPTGTVVLDQKIWDSFRTDMIFGVYKVDGYEATITAEDLCSGIEKIEYVISEKAYESATALANAALVWKNYSENSKPVIDENKDQIIYVKLTDVAGNETYLSSEGIHADTIAPVITDVQILDTKFSGETSLDFAFKVNEAGTYYYAVLKADQAAPTAEELKGQALEAAAKGSGNITAEMAGTAISLTAGNLELNTTYVVYLAAEDQVIRLSDGTAVPNVSEVVSSEMVSTFQTDLDSDLTKVSVENALYTGEKTTPKVEVWYDGKKLTEYQDYEVIYHNNVEISGKENEEAPYVEIVGRGRYCGTITENFTISYLEADDGYYVISGTEGENGYYISEVCITAATGYELIKDLQTGETGKLVLDEEKEHSVTFKIRRLSDSAVTDNITLTIKIDRTAPTGSITLEKKVWEKFLSAITFGFYKVNDKQINITAKDGYSGVDKCMYMISEKSYASAEAIEKAKVQWKEYSESNQPVIEENKNQIIYAKLMDKAGNISYISYISSDGIIADTVAPIISGLKILQDKTLTETGLNFTFKVNEAADYYYAVMKADQTAPTAKSLKEQKIDGAVTGSGTITEKMIGEAVTINVSGLKENTAYVVYLVAEDHLTTLTDGTAASNTSKVVSSESVSTKKKETAVSADTSGNDETVSENSEKTSVSNAVSTGDQNQMMVWIIVLLVSLAAFLLLKWKKRKQK